jgi:caffeoyl-CoA O-methyltransferase
MVVPNKSWLFLMFWCAGLVFSGELPGQTGPAGDRGGDAQLEKPPVPLDEFERNALAVIAEIEKNQRYLNVPQHDGRLLRIMAQSIGARNVVEVGTSTGISGIWIGLGLKETGGKLVTYEIDPGRAEVARQNFQRAGLSDRITVVEGDAHQKLKELTGTVDMVFLDADKEGYIDYLNILKPLLRPGALILAHNINPRQAHPPFMEAITTDPNLETVVRGGMSISIKKR